MQKKYLICGFMILGMAVWTSCGKEEASKPKEIAPAVEQIQENESNGNAEAEPETENVSNPLDEFELPESMKNIFQFGTYEEPIRVSNSENLSEVKVSDHIELPESNVLAVVRQMPWGEYSLWDTSPDDVLKMVDLIQAQEVQKTVPEEMAEEDMSMQVTLVTGEGTYVVLSVHSHRDGLHEIYIMQEEEEHMAQEMIETGDPVYIQSQELYDYLREIYGLERIALEDLQSASEISYESLEGGRVMLSAEQQAEFLECMKNAEQIENFSVGCPFELKVAVKAEGGEKMIYCATDSCGVIVLGDSTYQLLPEDREKLQTIFEKYSWV